MLRALGFVLIVAGLAWSAFLAASAAAVFGPVFIIPGLLEGAPLVAGGALLVLIAPGPPRYHRRRPRRISRRESPLRARPRSAPALHRHAP